VAGPDGVRVVSALGDIARVAGNHSSHGPLVGVRAGSLMLALCRATALPCVPELDRALEPDHVALTFRDGHVLVARVDCWIDA
jgi:hypothetical protein